MLWPGPGHLAGREVLVDVERHQRDARRRRPTRRGRALAGRGPVHERGEDRDHGLHAAAGRVADRRARQRGPAVGVAARAVEVAADREVVEVVAGPLRARPGLAVAAWSSSRRCPGSPRARRRSRCRAGRPRRAGSSRSPRRRAPRAAGTRRGPAAASGRAARAPCRGGRCTRRTAARSARPTASAAARPSRRARRSRPASATCARPGRRSPRSSTVTPSSRPVMPSAQKFFGRPSSAAGDDVLLDLRRAAADRVDHGVAVRRLGPALHRRVFGAHPQLAARARRCPSTRSASRRENSVANSLYSDASIGRRRRARHLLALHRRRDDAQAEHARHLGVGDEPRDVAAHDRVVPQRLAVALARCARSRSAGRGAA